MMRHDEKTIIALATPRGKGAIGLIRISGKETFKIIEKIFRDKKNKPLKNKKSNQINFGYITHKNKKIDQVLISRMASPNTYTGENTAEITCHNNIWIIKKIINLCTCFGARIADPGEFTLRAFLNGKKDLTQAEAVDDLIKAESDIEQTLALKQLMGETRNKINDWREEVLNQLAEINVRIDHDEDNNLQNISNKKSQTRIKKLIKEMKENLAHGEKTEKIKDGVRIVIVGKPNVGKSSVFNSIIEENRAIVTNIPGTTRDALVGQIDLEGIKLKLIDTAGIRKVVESDKRDKIEIIGIKKSKEKIKESDIILLVIDISKKLGKNDKEIIDEIKTMKKHIVIAGNKTDKGNKIKEDEINLGKINNVSAKNNVGIKELVKTIMKRINKENYADEKGLMISLRHRALINKTIKKLEEYINNINKKESLDLIAFDLQESLTPLNEILGKDVSIDMLDKIFSNFCVGK